MPGQVGRRSVVLAGGAALAAATVVGARSVLAGTAPPAGPPAAEPPPAGPPAARRPVVSVTLLTGDLVLVDPARPGYEFRPAPGRDRVSHRSLAMPGHHYVIPDDAAALVASGRVDPRLFDVAALAGTRGGLALELAGPGRTWRESVAPARLGRRWIELTEPAPDAAQAGGRQLRSGVLAVRLAGSAPGPRGRVTADRAYQVTFAYRDRDGAGTATANTVVCGIDDPGVFEFVAPGDDGTASVTLPEGRYLCESVVETPRPGRDAPAKSVIVAPEVTIARDTRILVDATAAEPIRVAVPDPAAEGVGVLAMYERMLGAVPWTSVHGSPDGTALFTAQDGPELPEDQLEAVAVATFARPGPDGVPAGSPVTIHAARRQRGRFFTGLRAVVTESELSTVRAEHGASAAGRHATKSAVVVIGRSFVAFHGLEYAATPFTRIERYAGDVQWANQLTEYAPGGDPYDRTDLTTHTRQPTVYRPGRRYRERWNVAPFWADPQVHRGGDTLLISPALYGDQDGHVGTSAVRRAHLALYRDGTLVGESDQLDVNLFDVPSGSAAYRLTVTAERDFTDLAASTSAIWCFTSSGRDAPADPGGRLAKLPLLSVRWAPAVDLYGRAPAGRVVPVPVRVEGVPPGAAVRSLAVEVSYDRGRAWRRVPVTGAGHRRVAMVPHPAGAVTVALRTTAADSTGNSVRQTVVDAYRLADSGAAPHAKPGAGRR